jgi:hypothetical protein
LTGSATAGGRTFPVEQMTRTVHTLNRDIHSHQ